MEKKREWEKDFAERVTRQCGFQLKEEDKNKASYEITGEIGRGGSCIVYDACYQTNTGDRKSVRIKELYPVGMRITRGIDGIHLEGEYTDSFEKTKVDFAKTFKKTNELFSVNGLTNSITNTIDFYNLNNTCYVVTVLNEGTSLDKKIDELSLHDRISTALSVAKAMKKIHEAGYLYFDLKPENVFVFPETTELVQHFAKRRGHSKMPCRNCPRLLNIVEK